MVKQTRSRKGRGWDGKKLTEDNLHSSVKVTLDGEEYETGNRRHTLVELWKDKKFQVVVDMSEINLVREEKNKVSEYF